MTVGTWAYALWFIFLTLAYGVLAWVLLREAGAPEFGAFLVAAVVAVAQLAGIVTVGKLYARQKRGWHFYVAAFGLTALAIPVGLFLIVIRTLESRRSN